MVERITRSEKLDLRLTGSSFPLFCKSIRPRERLLKDPGFFDAGSLNR